jgi:hypothetical protein
MQGLLQVASSLIANAHGKMVRVFQTFVSPAFSRSGSLIGEATRAAHQLTSSKSALRNKNAFQYAKDCRNCDIAYTECL